uniref:Endo/exonuclease/phosphatase domain-containing protein n=1 Tax=Haemonchus contortus TaxID=6289 RepID=A0A7I4XW38_HAECO
MIRNGISAHAPQADCPKREIDEFHLSLDDAIRSVPEEDYLTMGGDLNGHVDSEWKGQGRVHGGRGVGVRNEGDRVLNLDQHPEKLRTKLKRESGGGGCTKPRRRISNERH